MRVLFTCFKTFSFYQAIRLLSCTTVNKYLYLYLYVYRPEEKGKNLVQRRLRPAFAIGIFSSTSNVLVDFTYHAALILYYNLHVLCLLKAFGVVRHSLPLWKLSSLIILHSVFNWIKAFLTILVMSVKHLMAAYYFRHNSEIWNLHHTFECYALHFRLLGKVISIHRRMLISCLYMQIGNDLLVPKYWCFFNCCIFLNQILGWFRWSDN